MVKATSCYLQEKEEQTSQVVITPSVESDGDIFSRHGLFTVYMCCDLTLTDLAPPPYFYYAQQKRKTTS